MALYGTQAHRGYLVIEGSGTQARRGYVERGGNMGPSLVGSLGLSCWYKRLLSCLGCPSQSISTYFFITLLCR